MLIFVGVDVEVTELRREPIDIDPQGVQGVQSGMGVVGEEESVGSRGFPENNSFEFQVRQSGEQLHLFQ